MPADLILINKRINTKTRIFHAADLRYILMVTD